MALAAVGSHGAALFEGAPAGADPLRVLTLGSVGALAGGQIGTVLGILNRAVGDGCPIEVAVCSTGLPTVPARVSVALGLAGSQGQRQPSSPARSRAHAAARIKRVVRMNPPYAGRPGRAGGATARA